MTDDVPFLDGDGNEIGRARIVCGSQGEIEIECDVTDLAAAERIFVRPASYTYTCLGEDPASPGETDFVGQTPTRNLVEDARQPVADAVDRIKPKTGTQQFAALADPAHAAAAVGITSDLTAAWTAAAMEEQHRLEESLAVNMLHLSADHRQLIGDEADRRSKLFERFYYETAKTVTTVRTPRAQALASLLDDLHAGRLWV